MESGLAYFKKVYDEVPGWVQKMHDYKPEMLDHYTALRGASMSAGVLSVKEKDILLVGMNAARNYTRSMGYHTKGAIDGGATLEELIEYLSVTYVVGGETSLRLGLQSFEYAAQLLEEEIELLSHEATAVEIFDYYAKYSSKKQYFADVKQAIENEQDVAEILLTDNVVNEKMKYLLMVGSYTSRLQHTEVDEWTKKARTNGVEENELAELGFTCLLTAGIPAWFEISDALL